MAIYTLPHLLLPTLLPTFLLLSVSSSQRQNILGDGEKEILEQVPSFPAFDPATSQGEKRKTAANNGTGERWRDNALPVQGGKVSVCWKRGEGCREATPILRNTHRRKRSSGGGAVECDMEVSISAFDSAFSLCLFARSFQEEAIVREDYRDIKVTVFQEGSRTMELPLHSLELEHVSGFVRGQPFSSVNGYLQNHHFFGIIHIEDHVHYLEPSFRRSKDLHLYLNAKDRLIHKLNPGKGPAKHCQVRQCRLTLVADHRFYSEIGQGSLHTTLTLLLWHVKEANRVWTTLDLDNDRQSDCLRLTVGEVTVFTSANSSVNLLTGAYHHPEDFLKRFSRYNFDGFCLGVLFTSREFDQLVLGLAWRGHPRQGGVGGLCQRRVRIRTDANAYSFNALFVSMKSTQEKRIPVKMGVLNLVHELLHSFGAQHDPEPEVRPDCTPWDRNINGRFLMSKFSNDGHKLNHQLLSPCTKEQVAHNLATNSRVTCLTPGQGSSVCGDMRVEGQEECDCGSVFMCTASRSCCVPPEGRGQGQPCTWRKEGPCSRG